MKKLYTQSQPLTQTQPHAQPHARSQSQSLSHPSRQLSYRHNHIHHHHHARATPTPNPNPTAPSQAVTAATTATTSSTSTSNNTSGSNLRPSGLLRVTVTPISRLLSRNNNNQFVSTSSPDRYTNSNANTVETSNLKILRKPRSRSHARTPSRSRSRSRSCSPPPVPTQRALYRMGRRFPSSSFTYSNNERNNISTVSLEAMDDFFETFAPPSLRSFSTHKLLEEVEEGEGEGKVEGEAEAENKSINKVDKHQDLEPVKEDGLQADTVVELEPKYHPSEVEEVEVNVAPMIDQEELINAVEEEAVRLRRIVRQQLDEDETYRKLLERIEEHERHTIMLEGRLDQLQAIVKKGSKKNDNRPYMRLSLMILDSIASIILFIISFCISRPITLIRKRLSASSSPSASASTSTPRTPAHAGLLRVDSVEECDGDDHFFPLSSNSFGSGTNWSQLRASWRLSTKDLDLSLYLKNNRQSINSLSRG